MFKLKRVNDRLDALETCLLTMTALREHLRKEETKLCSCLPIFDNKYEEEIIYIDSFLNYLFAQEEKFRKEKNDLLK